MTDDPVKMRLASLETGLDDDQRAALLHDTDAKGALLLSSGPGTGKTTVLSRRAARLLLDGRDPASILGMTLTVAAAEELLERTIDHLCRIQYGVDRPEMRGFLGDVAADPNWRAAARWVDAAARRLKIATHHSFAAWILRDRVDGVQANIVRLGIPEQFSLVEHAVLRERAAALIEAEKKSGGDTENVTVKSLLQRVALAKSRDELPHPIKGDDIDRVAFLFMRAWRRDGVAKGILDFGDLPILAAELLRKDAALLTHYQRRFRHFILDEFQDTTPAQMKLLKLVMGDAADLMAAGDVNQAVQTTRGTDPELLRRFSEHFPGASVIRLKTNYRATSPIHAVAAKIDGDASAAGGDGPRAIRRRFFTVREEAEFFAAECRRLREEGQIARWSEAAAIFRRMSLAEPYKEALESAGIPVHVMGNRDFWSLREILEARSAWIIAAVFTGLTPPEAVVERAMAGITPEQQEAVKQALAALPPGAAIPVAADAIFTAAGFSPEREANDATNFRRLRNVDHLRALTVRFTENFDGDPGWPAAAPYFDGYLETMAAEAREAASTERDAVVLLPAPSAKGLEWPAVFLPALEEGLFPSDAWKFSDSDEEKRRFILDEEQRLFYVALTRARRFLYLTHAYRRTIDGKEVFLSPSRFLKFIPQAAVDASDSFVEETGAVRWKQRLSRFKAWLLED